MKIEFLNYSGVILIREKDYCNINLYNIRRKQLYIQSIGNNGLTSKQVSHYNSYEEAKIDSNNPGINRINRIVLK